MAADMNPESGTKPTGANIGIGTRELRSISDRILVVLQKNLNTDDFGNKELHKSVKTRSASIFRKLLAEKLDIIEDVQQKTSDPAGTSEGSIVEEPFDELATVCQKRKHSPYQCAVWTARTCQHQARYLNRVKAKLPERPASITTIPLTDSCGDRLANVANMCNTLLKRVPKVSSKAEKLSKCLDMHTAQLSVTSPPNKTADDGSPPSKFRVVDSSSSQLRDGFVLYSNSNPEPASSEKHSSL